MIKLTYKELLEATASGAYARFRAIPKTITAGHKNRKVPAAIDVEVRHFIEQRDAIVSRFGGVINMKEETVSWPEGKGAEATKALDELLSQTIELPGDPIKMVDLLEGGLLETDYDRLDKFLTE